MCWRDTLFVWRGDMEFGEIHQKIRRAVARRPHQRQRLRGRDLRWKGRWVGVDAADATKADMPPVRDWRDGANGFESDNLFNVIGGPPQEACLGSTTSPVASESWNHDPEARKYDHVGWQLDNGDGHEWYRDSVHDMRCCGDDEVFARGQNQFAPFIAVGFLSGYRFRVGDEARRQCRRTLTVARRYLDDGDERCGWSMDDLEREVREAMASSVPTHPWMVECMGSAKRKKRKR